MRATDDLVVVVPGIIGSVLRRADGTSLWGTIGDIKRVLRTGGRELMVRNGESDDIVASGLV